MGTHANSQNIDILFRSRENIEYKLKLQGKKIDTILKHLGLEYSEEPRLIDPNPQS